MSFMQALLHGLWVTLYISLFSLLIGAIPGALLFWGKDYNYKIVHWICSAYIEIFKGIPLIVQLFFIYYALPMICRFLTFSAIGTAMIVLSLNASADIANILSSQIGNRQKEINMALFIKNIGLSLIKESGKLIRYSALLSIIGITELFRFSTQSMAVDNKIFVFLTVIAIYLLLSVSTNMVYKRLRRVVCKDFTL